MNTIYAYHKNGKIFRKQWNDITEIPIPDNEHIIVKRNEQGEITHWVISEYFLSTFEFKLIKDTFKQCFGLQSCFKSDRTQPFAITALSERTGLKIEFIKNNLEEIINL